MKIGLNILLVIALCDGMLPCAALGQSDGVESKESVRITGRVVDPVNLPLPRTTVKLTPVGSETVSTSVLADDDGRFVFQAVPSQSYELRFDEAGFLSRKLPIPKSATDHDVDVGVIVLQIGEVTEGPLVPVKARKKAKPVTVCEALANRKKFSGKPLAIVGRMDCGISLVDHVCFLAQDHCEQPVTTDGYAWPNKVLIVDYSEEGMPKPPATTPEIDQNTLMKTLSLIRKTATLGLHREPRFKTEGRTITFSHFADVNDEWGMAYGLVFTAPNLRKDDCGDEIGCGGFDGAPIAVITLPNAVRTLGGDNDSKPNR